MKCGHLACDNEGTWTDGSLYYCNKHIKYFKGILDTEFKEIDSV